MKDGTWRVGRKVGRTVYIGDELVGLMDTPELAETVVRAVNGLREFETQAQFGAATPIYSCARQVLSDDPSNVVLFECTLLDEHEGPHLDRGHSWVDAEPDEGDGVRDYRLPNGRWASAVIHEYVTRSRQPVDPCSCRPLPNGLDVDQRCPSHGRTS